MLIGNGGTRAVKLFDADGNFIEDIVPSGTANLLLPNAVVLREKETVSVFQEVEEVQFLKSNIGRVFYQSDDFEHIINQIEIYHISGRKVEQREIMGPMVWEAHNFNEGIYIIKGITKTKKTYTAKVIVN